MHHANLTLSLFPQLNTVLILLALRQFLHLKRVHQQARSAYDSPLEGELVNSDHPSQFRCINKMCKFNFIFRSTYFNINLLVCTLPAFAVYWCFSVLALEQMQTSAFQFIFALLNFLFSCCLLLLNLPYVRIRFWHIFVLADHLRQVSRFTAGIYRIKLPFLRAKRRTRAPVHLNRGNECV